MGKIKVGFFLIQSLQQRHAKIRGEGALLHTHITCSELIDIKKEGGGGEREREECYVVYVDDITYIEPPGIILVSL